MATDRDGKPLAPIQPHSDKWERLANKEARCFVSIKACRDCNYPVVDGYCCSYCGSTLP